MTEGPLLCEGDSGGAALSDNEAVIGVFSQFTGGCTDPSNSNFFAEMAPFADAIILPAFEAAGAVPWLEGNSEPGIYCAGGASGTGGDSATGGATATSAGGGTSVSAGAGGAPSETGGDTSEVYYDQGPPKVARARAGQ